ncbi:hypothetical protein MMINT_16000 [Candidatus Methanomassiliicoccus intestinalis Issoire-Mx1]|uniref:Probable membrane transporter protein n=2 Tax=Candidatus Methanomassiliicoccus intestinalis TaxID=1406512 RepID=R9TB30_METII|nr:hypothetical protein MMINT_16000 [Candidatus Methanomassiliicoccus intestinalis Issoire-Mx1]
MVEVMITAAAAGIIGSMFGIGGGLIVIPVLTLIFGLPMKEAIGASLISIIATSTSAASRYVSKGMANMKLGMFLEPFTVAGSITGAAIAMYLNQEILSALFAVILIYGSYHMAYGKKSDSALKDKKTYPSVSGSYMDEGKEVSYDVVNLPRGMAASFGAGNISGMLGVGGGIIKVPVMNLWMNVPMKAATATSNFMIGVTALASASVYYVSGRLSPTLAASVAIGAFLGTKVGPILALKTASDSMKKMFAVLMIIIAIAMILKVFGYEVM